MRGRKQGNVIKMAGVVLLTAILMTACTTPNTTSEPTATPTSEPTAAPTATPTSEPTTAPTATPEPTVMAQSLEEILEAIYANITSQLPMIANREIEKENTSYYFGIQELDFVEALASESMITAVPYSVCLLRALPGTDMEALKKEIVESVNPQKWICVGVSPEDVLVGSIGDVTLLVMTRGLSQEIMDAFLSLQEEGEKAPVVSQVVNPDANGLLEYKGSYAKALEPYSERSVVRLAEKIESIYEKYLTGQTNVYYSVIPDKSFFMPNTAFSIDEYFEMLYVLQQNVASAQYIPLNYNLRLEDYYKSDLHWKQDSLFSLLSTLGNVMDFAISETDFTDNVLQPYSGIYAPYMENEAQEELHYLTNSHTEEAIVEIYDKGTCTGVYLLEEWSSDVPYNMFLGGPNPLVTITNPSVNSGRELIIFGDSFASSLAPLLTGVYEKITLVDLRFVMSDYLAEVMSFDGQEVLFLYNMAVLNNSAMLK